MKTIYSRFPCVLVEELAPTEPSTYRLRAIAFRADRGLKVSESIECDYSIDVCVNDAVKKITRRLLDKVTL